MNAKQCQVCGNSPARKYYNAVVCHACRVFFYRCILWDPPGTCRDGNNCVMVPGFRKNCSYCRFQLCLSVNMAVDKAAKIKKYKPALKMCGIPQQTMVAMAKQYHPFLIARDHTLSALSIDSLLMWHKFYSTLYEKMEDISQQKLITHFQACLSRLRPLDSHSESEPYDAKNSPYYHCRHIVSYIDFLISSHYFNELSPQDKEYLARENITNFLLFCLMKSRLKYGQVAANYFDDQHKIMNHQKQLVSRCLLMLDKLYFTVIYPLYIELNFDEMECIAVQAITMYSSAIELSDGGMKKVISARDAFTLKLMEYIENSRPELTRYQQLDRLSKLLGIVNEIRKAGRLFRDLFAEAVLKNYNGLDGKITYDIYVNSKE